MDVEETEDVDARDVSEAIEDPLEAERPSRCLTAGFEMLGGE